MNQPTTVGNGDLEATAAKREVALSSVLAGFLLILVKLLCGLLTGSLGILAEAAHSGLDLVAALVTYFAVRAASKPADEEHNYGHGKIENLAAVFETLLLLATAGWVITEAVERFRQGGEPPRLGALGVAVMAAAIFIDWSRSRALKRAAVKYRSQALEADALHFSTDIWSSLAVIAGLLYVSGAEKWGWPGPETGDAAAALLVALFVLATGIRMGRRACQALVDRSPKELGRRLTATVRALPGIEEPVRVRVRRAGGNLFVDVRAALDRRLPLEEVYRLAGEIENAVREAAGEPVDFLLQTTPFVSPNEGLTAKVHHAAGMEGAAVHNVKLLRSGERTTADLHLEVDGEIPLDRAHELADRLEERIRRETGKAGEVVIHLEPTRRPNEVARPAAAAQVSEYTRVCAETTRKIPGLRACQDVRLTLVGGDTEHHHLTARVLVELPATVRQAHERCERLEKELRRHLPLLRRITLHAEPPRKNENAEKR